MVLLVDDDPAVLRSMTRVLRELAVPIKTAGSAAEALAAIQTASAPAIVISDNSMPGMTGLEFLEEVERHHPEVFRILHTGDTRVEFDVKPGSMITVVGKPVEPEALRRLVWSVLSAKPAPGRARAS